MPIMFDKSDLYEKYDESDEYEYYISIEVNESYNNTVFVKYIYNKTNKSWERKEMLIFPQKIQKIKKFGNETRYITDNLNHKSWLKYNVGYSFDELLNSILERIPSKIYKKPIKKLFESFIDRFDLPTEYFNEGEQFRRCLCCDEWEIFLDDSYTNDLKDQEVIIDPHDIICGRCVNILRGLEEYFNQFYIEFYKDPITLEFIRKLKTEKSYYDELEDILKENDTIPARFIQKVLEIN
jgi:hypothetical protein